jgi:uncharacterized membrane protein (DUF485 family)
MGAGAIQQAGAVMMSLPVGIGMMVVALVMAVILVIVELSDGS